jgi:hypothetical protein
MKIADKLRNYISENGIQIKWFAEKIGMKKEFFYGILHKNMPIPIKYWFPIIELSRGHIALGDFVAEKLKMSEEEIEIISSPEHPTSCMLCKKSNAPKDEKIN